MPFSVCRRLLALVVVLATLAAATASARETVAVVASFSIIGDMVQRVGGERIKVHTLVGHDADAHVYQPTPADAKVIARADLVVINGYGFEGWIERLVKSSGYRGKVVVAAAGAATLKRKAPAAAEVDPHAWQDLANALRYVDNIEAGLRTIDPEGAAYYRASAARYKDEIAALEREIRALFATIPEPRRRVVTSHDAFGYFSRAYGIAFIAPIGVNTDAEPSAADIGRIIRQIRREKIPAVFLEGISDPRLLERIQSESGARAGGTLHSDALTKPGGAAPSYLELMRGNAKTLAAALTQP